MAEEFEVIDADADLDEPRSKTKSKKDQSDDDMFDPLDRNIQFPDDSADDEDTEDAEDTEDEDDGEPARRDADEDEEEDEGPTRGRREGNDKWSRRLARERRLREEAEQDADHYQQEFGRLNKRLDEIATKLETQKSGGELDKKIADLSSQLAKVKSDLKVATEAGDTDKVIDLNEKMSDIKSDIKLAEYQKTQVKTVADTTAATNTAATKAPNRHYTRWMRQHGRKFNGDPVFKAAATEASNQLAREGYPAADSEHFAELDKRLYSLFPKEFPNIASKNKDGKRRRAPISAGDEGGGPAPSREGRGDGLDIRVRGNKAQLTKRHESIMEKFGLDPDSKEDRQAFVRENLAPKKR